MLLILLELSIPYTIFNTVCIPTFSERHVLIHTKAYEINPTGRYRKWHRRECFYIDSYKNVTQKNLKMY